jgi:hypothetical protein
VAHGHDVHFLERLERLSTPETELALSLYQDPLLIRALLEQIRWPEGAARVALSLGDGERGPFVVIATRSWRIRQPSRHEPSLRPAAMSRVRAARARSTSGAMDSDTVRAGIK